MSQLTPTAITALYLRRCQRYRAEGGAVSYTTDPAWLVNMAINRRAGWPDDPSHSRGSAMPVNGKYPCKAEGMRFMDLWRLAQAINTPRLIVRDGQLGGWKRLIYKRIAGRITQD